MNSHLDSFIKHYLSLSEKEKFNLGAEFNQATSGTLSPFNSPKPVAVALVPVQNKDKISLLALQRTIDPNKGRVALPGGYVDEGESVEEAVGRELMEETGIKLNLRSFEMFQTPQPAGQNTLLLFMKSKTIIPWDTFIIASQKVKDSFNKNKDNAEASKLVLVDSARDLSFPLHAKMGARFLQSLSQDNNANKKIRNQIKF